MAARIAIGCDHGGYFLKEKLKKFLSEKGYDVKDFGAHSEESCDYPGIGYEVAKSVSKKKYPRGILICKSGIGMAIIANKLPGVRSAVCNTVRQAETSRLHNDTNLLSLAAEYVRAPQAAAITEKWLNTRALGGRHRRRVRQIAALEKKKVKQK